MKDTLKGIHEFFTGFASDFDHLNSGDPNRQWAAGFRVAARAARLLDQVSPPIGKVFSVILTMTSIIRPFRDEDGVSTTELLINHIDNALMLFDNQGLIDDYNRVVAQMRAISRALERDSQLSDTVLIAQSNFIVDTWRSNTRDSEPSYALIDVLGDRLAQDLDTDQNPDMIALRIVNFVSLARERINQCRDRASIFRRLTNDDDLRDLAQSEVLFWSATEVNATIRLVRDKLGRLANPPSIHTRDFSPVFSAWHRVQSPEQREDLETFMEETLGIRIPGNEC